MGDEGEKTCPLCAEEMDLTDQQLKPCRCGYQICVWCWHHIIDMAEKDQTEGRCPACRTPYDKERIVGMAANCERLVADVNVERKKSQKAKSKPSEGRKQLNSMRVIQRNLVYIVGLPLDLADEDLLQHKDYFGQYGRVLKVSMSRTASGIIQQFPNNTCSVYITYSKEEEAIRCIQSVHGFVLDGRSLKACFGTTKYCHAWLRNVPCTNPDCLYLHEIGSQEDSFTKDEIISAYTRSRVQQITGVTNNLQRRAGSMLPPPVDDYCNNSSTAKPILKNASTNTQSTPKSSPPNGNSSRSATLPSAASWGMRAPNQTLAPSSAGLTEPSKQKSGAFLSTFLNTTRPHVSNSDVLKKSEEKNRTLHAQNNLDLQKPLKQETPGDCVTDLSDIGASTDRPLTRNQISCFSASADDVRVIRMPSDITNSRDGTQQSHKSIPREEGNTDIDGMIQRLSTHVASMSVQGNAMSDHSGIMRPVNLHSDDGFIESPGNEGSQQHSANEYRGVSALQMSGGNEVSVSITESDGGNNGIQSRAQNSEIEDDILSFNNQRLKDPEIVSHSVDLADRASLLHTTNHMQVCSSQYNGELCVNDPIYDSLSLDSRESDRAHLSHGYPEKVIGGSGLATASLENPFLFPDEARTGKQIGNLLHDSQGHMATDTREDSIISNILSLDFDESLTSPQNLAKLLGETDKETSSLKLSNSWKVQNNNQSRFSFARQEEPKSQTFEVNSYSLFNQLPNNNRFYQDSAQNQDPYLQKFGVRNGLSPSYLKGLDNFTSNPAVFSSNKLSFSRPPISAPPGFSIPSRTPPPGFSSNERMEQNLDLLSGNRLLESSMLRNTYGAPPVEAAGGVGNIELMDPAILAVGQGRRQSGLDSASLDLRSNFPAQLSAFENEAKLQQLLMQNPQSLHHNLRFPGIGDNNLSSLMNSYGISSRLMDQSQGSSLSPFPQVSVQQPRTSPMPNGHWDGWNGMTELLRNERLSFNKFYGNYEGSTFQMPSSGDIFNGNYGI